MSYIVSSVTAGEPAIAGQVAGGVYGELRFVSDSGHRARERVVRDTFVDHVKRGLQFLDHRGRSGLERHRGGRQLDAVTALCGARNGDRDLTLNRYLPEHRTNGGTLRNVIGRKLSEPRGSFREARDQVWAAECSDYDRLSGGEQLSDDGALLGGEGNVTFAVGDAHEEGGDGDVVGVRRRQLQARGAHEFRIGAQRSKRADTTTNFRLDRFARVRIGIGAKRDEKTRRGFVRIERQRLRRVAEEGDAAVGDFLRFLGIFAGGRTFGRFARHW